MRTRLILLGLFALLGIFLLRGGISGLTIYENCCYPPDCAPENICPTTGATLEKPAFLSAEDSNALSVIGLLITVISVLMIFGYLRKKVWEEKEEQPNP